MNKIVLVLATQEDIHADAVISHLNDLGRSVVRLDPSELWAGVSKLTWQIDQTGSRALLNWRGRTIDADQVGAVYNRSFSFARCDQDEDIATLLEYAESRAALYGFFRSLENAFWLNRPWREEMVDNKPYQYVSARQLGLKVPKTLVTNDPLAFTTFYENCGREVIVKQLSEICLVEESHAKVEGSEEPEQTAYGFFTNKVREEHLAMLDEIVHSPCLFQELIPKKADIRVTVVGDKVFASLIDSQTVESAQVDFRREPLLPTEDYRLPDAVEQQLLALMRRWGIHFAACDFILTTDDQLVFLEANVVGNWMWLYNDKEDPISREIAELIDRMAITEMLSDSKQGASC